MRILGVLGDRTKNARTLFLMGKFYGLSQHINNEIHIIMEKKFGYRQWRLSLSDNIQCEPVDVYYTITIMVKLEPLNLKPHNNTMSN